MKNANINKFSCPIFGNTVSRQNDTNASDTATALTAKKSVEAGRRSESNEGKLDLMKIAVASRAGRDVVPYYIV